MGIEPSPFKTGLENSQERETFGPNSKLEKKKSVNPNPKEMYGLSANALKQREIIPLLDFSHAAPNDLRLSTPSKALTGRNEEQ